MSKFVKYIKKGMNQSILVGTPDFDINNESQDFENMSGDFQYSRNIIQDEVRKVKLKKSTRKK